MYKVLSLMAISFSGCVRVSLCLFACVVLVLLFVSSLFHAAAPLKK